MLMSPNRKELTISDLRPEDSGCYYCSVKERDGKDYCRDIKVNEPRDAKVGNWRKWSSWTTCRDCEFKMRYRNCAGVFCRGPGLQWEKISMSEKKGTWGEWGSWSTRKSCGVTNMTRRRTCLDSRNCEGPSEDSKRVYGHSCEIDGGWTAWSPWGQCSTTCGGGERQRTRECWDPKPQSGGRECSGLKTDISPCNTHPCPVDGGWSEWGKWGFCSPSCGQRTQMRSRACNDPVPQGDGLYCLGEQQEFQICPYVSCDNLPRSTNVNVRGSVRGTLHVLVSDQPFERTIITRIYNPEDQEKWPRYMPFILSPIAWSVAKRRAEALSGFLLTDGNFYQRLDIRFQSGEVLTLTHVARQLASNDNSVEVTVNGAVPSHVLQSYQVDYIQVAPGTVYSRYLTTTNVDGTDTVLTWNANTTYYTDREMRFLVQTLSVGDILIEAEPSLITCTMTVAIDKKFTKDTCPGGFHKDEMGKYCQG